MAKLRLHLDSDSSRRSLYQALLAKGHDVTRTPSAWMPGDASDEAQLLGATEHGRALFTFNIRDFTLLSRVHLHHAGIVLAAQQSWKLPGLIVSLDRLLSISEAEELAGRILWLPPP